MLFRQSLCWQRLPKLLPMKNPTGFTLIELLLSISLGLLIIIATSGLFLTTHLGYTTQDEQIRLNESGRYALENISRALRQTGYANWEAEQAPILPEDAAPAMLAGSDARSVKENTDGISVPVNTTVNGSDLLAVYFFGAGTASAGDGTIVNCAGFSIAAPTSSATAQQERGASIFYVATDASGEPELRCKYQGKTNWTAEAIARGVESFQVLYGVDLDGDGLPNRFLNADALNTLDNALSTSSTPANPALSIANKNSQSSWKKVVSVKIALLMRGAQKIRNDTLRSRFDLFGKNYANVYQNIDNGTSIDEASLSAKNRNRLRKIFTTTILLRNPLTTRS